jgi:chromosome segregation ATPase
MATTKLAELELKVKGLIERSSELKRRNANLEGRLREAEAKLARQETSVRKWEKERDWLRGRIKKVLEELGSIKFEG